MEFSKQATYKYNVIENISREQHHKKKAGIKYN